MVATLLFLGAALLGQTGAALYGDIPADVPTFHLTANGTELGCVALVSGGDWFHGTIETLPVNNIGVIYVPDTPWQHVERAKLPRGAELSPEIAASRRDRLKRDWKANGFTFIQTAAGTEIPVSETDRALAKQAAEDAARIEKRSAPENVAIGTVSSSTTAAGPESGRPAWRGYIGHLIVIVVALIAGAVIVKVLLLDNDGGWDKI